MSVPVYLVVNITITDAERFGAEYAAKVGPHMAAHGGEMIAMGQPPHLVEGEDSRGGAAIFRFPSRDSFDAWYGADEYQPLKHVRLATTDTDVTTLMLLTAQQSAGDSHAA